MANLKALTPPPDKDIMTALADLMSRAERGEVQQLAFVASDTRGDRTTFYVGNRTTLIASLERMKFQILKEWDEEST